MRYVYHYHATKQMRVDRLIHIDGIANMQSPIITMDDYAELKKEIATGQEIGSVEGLVICSLSLIHEMEMP